MMDLGGIRAGGGGVPVPQEIFSNFLKISKLLKISCVIPPVYNHRHCDFVLGVHNCMTTQSNLLKTTINLDCSKIHLACDTCANSGHSKLIEG